VDILGGYSLGSVEKIDSHLFQQICAEHSAVFAMKWANLTSLQPLDRIQSESVCERGCWFHGWARSQS
jgi:hypothetical protein